MITNIMDTKDIIMGIMNTTNIMDIICIITMITNIMDTMDIIMGIMNTINIMDIMDTMGIMNMNMNMNIIITDTGIMVIIISISRTIIMENITTIMIKKYFLNIFIKTFF
jgi:hypothetical protein